jgi:hypothetical protein
MSAKVANVIAVELGLLIVILSWLAFSNFSRLKPAALAEELRAPENSMAMIRPVPRQPNYPQNAAPYATAPQPHLATGLQPAAQSNQALQYGALDYYDQPVASTPYTVANDTPTQTAPYYDSYYDPYYSGGYQQPTIPYPDDTYYSPNDYGYYPSPGQIIVVSNVARERSRACFNHPPMHAGPPRHPPGGGGQFRPPNRPGGRDSHPPGGVIAPRGGGGGGGTAIAPRPGNGGGGRSGATRGTGGSRSSGANAASMPR